MYTILIGGRGEVMTITSVFNTICPLKSNFFLNILTFKVCVYLFVYMYVYVYIYILGLCKD